MVVTTRLLLRDLVIDATTGPRIPLVAKASLNAFLVASEEKFWVGPLASLRISLLVGGLGLGSLAFSAAFDLFQIRGWDPVIVPRLAISAKEG